MRIEILHTKQLDEWIANRHYLHTTPAGARIRMAFYIGKMMVGAMMWGRPTARYIDNDSVMELTRCVFIDEAPKNTESAALAMARKYIRMHFPEIRAVLAYSSTGQGHEGTIYKADGWFITSITQGGKGWESREKRTVIDQSKKIRWMRSV